MLFTKAQLDRVPDIYRDFMLTLSPIIRSRDEVLRINGIPLGRIFTALVTKYQYTPEQIRKIADNLVGEGWVAEDKLGFFSPTAKGEDILRAILDAQEPEPVDVPPLPKL